MAAVIGISLYAVMPTVVFEAERDKEELLIERGEQYSRAIQLYFRKWKKYPARLEDLEDTNGQRYLRRRYVDPMTGKDNWRIVHVGPGGVFIDSLTKNKKTETAASSVNTFITELQPVGGGQQAQGDAGNEVWRRRRGIEPPGGGGPSPDLPLNAVGGAEGTPPGIAPPPAPGMPPGMPARMPPGMPQGTPG